MDEGNQVSPPDLPDIEKIVADAERRRDHYLEIENNARAFREQAERVIEQLTGKTRKKRPPKGQGQKRPERRVTDRSYEAVLTALGNRSYAGSVTLSGATGYHASTVGAAMTVAAQRGHARVEQRGRRMRYYITEQGEEFVTAKVGPLTPASKAAIARNGGEDDIAVERAIRPPL